LFKPLPHLAHGLALLVFLTLNILLLLEAGVVALMVAAVLVVLELVQVFQSPLALITL
jgi:hypothetical protein